jgi:general secretion pathway protein A
VSELASVRAATAAQTYEEYYGFTHAPFTLAPDPQFLYLSESHDDALHAIRELVARREGFAVLTGEIGTGKTTIARALLTRLDRTAFASLILNPFLSIEELLREVLLDFGVVSKEDVRSGRAAAASRDDLMRALGDFLSSIGGIGGHGVLILDEAQHMPAAVLDQLRLLANGNGNGNGHVSRPLQLVLLGLPSLADELGETPDLQPFDSRVSCQLRLTPLSRSDLDGYVAHRLIVARSSTAIYFNTEAMDLLHALSRGVPRSVNLLCDRALMLCARERIHEVGPDAIRRAGQALDMTAEDPVAVPQRRWRPSLATALALALGLAAILAFAPVADWINAPLPDLPGAPHVAQAPPAEPYPVPPTMELNLLPAPLPPAQPSPIFRAF